MRKMRCECGREGRWRGRIFRVFVCDECWEKMKDERPDLYRDEDWAP
jgi:hypothetical protein